MNVNDQVTVKLTAEGREILRNYQFKQKEILSKFKLDTDFSPITEMYTDQLWSIMNIFGSHFRDSITIGPEIHVQFKDCHSYCRNR